MTHKQYMKLAFDEAFKGIRGHKGGPFGAVIVSSGKIIGKGCNMVTSTNDPTAHAEVTAIRNACKNLKRFHLEDAVLYTSCEPCPMCLSAIYWAQIKTVYYCSSKFDTIGAGFIDKFIYDELKRPPAKRKLSFKKVELETGRKLFSEWTNMEDKINY